MLLQRLLALVALAALVAAPLALDAHTRRPTRAVVLQMDAVGAVTLWEAMVPGAPAELMGAFYDLNHDGQFDAREGKALSQTIISKSLNGVRLSWNGMPAAVASIESLLDRDVSAGEPLVALALAPLAIEPAQVGVLSLAVEHGGDLEVQVQGLDDWYLVGTDRGRLAVDGRGLAAPVALRAGERIQLVMERLGDGPGHQR